VIITRESWAAGRKFIVPPLAAAAGLAVARRPIPAAVMLAAGAGLASCFRDPQRTCPAEPGVIYAAADGRVTNVIRDEHLRWDPELGSLRIGVFLNVFDVHVARLPAAGAVARLEDIAGECRPAWSHRVAETNRRVRLVIGTPYGAVGVVWTAGLVARRVIPWVSEGAKVSAGQRGAIIVFGSRAELLLPDGFEPLVSEGDEAKAGMTAVARWADAVAENPDQPPCL
jgi:phosphatidylserine decarboxylase